MKDTRKIYGLLALLIFLVFLGGLTGCAGSSKAPSPEKRPSLVTRGSIPGVPLVGLIGDDHLGLQSSNYHATEVAKHHKKLEAIGWLDTTFGDSLTNVRSFLNTALVGLVRIHILNNTCVRNKNCGRYEPLYGYTLGSLEQAILRKDPKIINHLKTRVALYKQWRNSEHPNLHIGISPILEGNESDRAYEILADATKEVWPEVQLVNSKMDNKGQKYRGAWRECHGNILDKDCEIISTDGKEIMDLDSRKYITQAAGFRVKFRWSRRNNCRAQGNFVDPRKREDCLSGREAEQQVHVTDVVGNPPPRNFACSTKPFDSNDIWKPLAEDKGTPDARKNLPVIIPSDLGHSSVDLLTSNGKIAGKLGYYGKFTDGRPRSYSGHSGGSKKTGYEFQKEATRLSGSPYTWARAGGRCVGPFLPGRRQGEMYK